MGPTVTIIRAVLPERQACVQYLIQNLPRSAVIKDRHRDAMDTFLRALQAAGDRPALHLEDDIVLADHFHERAGRVISERPDSPVQFFSLRGKTDRAKGSRWEPGRTFLMGQCFYLPAGLSRSIHEYAAHWRSTDRGLQHPTGLDMMVGDYLAHHRIRYWMQVPSLVQHRASTSLIDPRRARTRQSPTFESPDDAS